MMRYQRPLRDNIKRRGFALLLVSFLITGLAVMSLALFTTVRSTGQQQKGSRDSVNALYVSEAGLGEAMMRLGRRQPGTLGSEEEPETFGSAIYWVQDSDLGNGVHSLVATGIENGVGSRLELVVREVTDNFFVWAAFGEETMTMDSNAFVDSYNSGDGDYEDLNVNGGGGSAWANENGHVGSNGNIEMRQNSDVHGSAVPGPGMSTTVLGNATVSGTTLPAAEAVEMPPIDVPVIASSGDHTVDGGDTEAFASGFYHFETFLMETTSTLNVQGPATLVFEDFEIASNAELYVDATNGPVEIYVIGDFIMNSNTLITSTTFTPADIQINLISDNIIDPQLDVDLDQVDLESNAQLFGTIYAPNATVDINSNFELFGALVARRVHLDSNAEVHFDEALLEPDEDEEIILETVCWRKVPYQP